MNWALSDFIIINQKTEMKVQCSTDASKYHIYSNEIVPILDLWVTNI